MAAVSRVADEQTSFVPHDHTLVIVDEGTLELTYNGQHIITVNAGECVFVRKDHRLRLRRIADSASGFHHSRFVYFPQTFLSEYYRKLSHDTLPDNIGQCESMLKIQHTPKIINLFDSFNPYCYGGERPDDRWLENQLAEAAAIVLDMHPEACGSLFNFVSRYRPDLLKFMEENFRYELTMEEIASYTGRSLATFKRDFAKVSTLSPRQWIFDRRLQDARERLISGDAPVQEVLKAAGFKNFSHFSRLYRKKYGCTPSSERRREKTDAN